MKKILNAFVEHGRMVAFALLIAGLCVLTPTSHAQTDISAQIDSLSAEVDKLAADFGSGDAPSASLEQIRTRALEISQTLQDVAADLGPEVSKLKQQLTALKPKPPADGDGKPREIKESDKAKQAREKIEARSTKVDSASKRATAVAAMLLRLPKKSAPPLKSDLPAKF